MPECKICGTYYTDTEKHECSMNEDIVTTDKIYVEPDTINDIVSPNQVLSTEKFVIGKKWFLFGIGGAGTHILDSIFIRKNHVELSRNEMLSKVWDAAIGGYVLLDTNMADVKKSFIAMEIKKWDMNVIDSFCRLGATGDDADLDDKETISGGAGGWYIAGEKAMKYTIDSGDLKNIRLTTFMENQMKSVQAIMFVHSTTNGTGCGATPVLAKHIRDEIAPQKLTFSLTVLPAIGRIESGAGRTACIGLANIVNSVDGVFLMDNNALADKKICNVDKMVLMPKQPAYYGKNRHIVEFLESFSLSSSVGNTLEDGDMFDVKDAIELARQHLNNNGRAPILIPIHGSIRLPNISKCNFEESINTLFHKTIIGGKLACCDHTKAKGASFIINGPEKHIFEISRLVNETEIILKMVRNEQFLNDEKKIKNIRFYPSVIKDAKEITMWGLLWNPPLKLMDRMVEMVHEYIEEASSDDVGKVLSKALPTIKEVHSDLGKYELIDNDY